MSRSRSRRIFRRSAATRSHARGLYRALRCRRPFHRRHGRFGPKAEQRRRPSEAAARACGAARGQGPAARRARRVDLYPMGGIAHGRLQPERRQKKPRHCRASRGRAGRRELQADRRVTRVASRALAPPQGGQPLSRPVLHQRRRSREAGPRFGGPRRADRGRHAAEDKTSQSPAAFAWAPVRRARPGA